MSCLALKECDSEKSGNENSWVAVQELKLDFLMSGSSTATQFCQLACLVAGCEDMSSGEAGPLPTRWGSHIRECRIPVLPVSYLRVCVFLVLLFGCSDSSTKSLVKIVWSVSCTREASKGAAVSTAFRFLAGPADGQRGLGLSQDPNHCIRWPWHLSENFIQGTIITTTVFT